jgi:hypothetical protein
MNAITYSPVRNGLSKVKVKVKVNFTLEEVRKAQKGSRVIVLIFP